MLHGKSLVTKAAIVFLVIGLFSCVTINIYFPAEEVKKTAEQIVGEIRQGDNQPSEPSPSKVQKEGALSNSFHFVSFTFLTKAYAGDETSVSNAAIRGIKARMKTREQQLRSYFNRKIIGENKDGYVAIRNAQSLSIKDRAHLQRLVEAENKDRKQLYKEVARALNVGSGQVSRIGRIFAEQWQKYSHKGWWIQKSNGQWVTR